MKRTSALVIAACASSPNERVRVLSALGPRAGLNQFLVAWSVADYCTRLTGSPSRSARGVPTCSSNMR